MDTKSKFLMGKFVKNYIISSFTFGVLGTKGFSTKMSGLLHRRQAYRVEKFSEAVRRVGVSEYELNDKAKQFHVVASLLMIVSFLFLIFFALGIAFDFSFTWVALMGLVIVWSISQALSWQFRSDQIRCRELFSFKDWVFNKRTGEFK